MAIKVLLADDHAIVRHGLSSSIQQQQDMKVVGQAKDGLTAVQLVAELSPDVVVMDISMPDINGVDATREIVRDYPKVKVIALSMHSEKKLVREMFRAGACAYLPKDCEFDELAEAIRTVMAGKSYVSPKTVEPHRLRVMEKLDIYDVAQLTKYAIQESLTFVET